MAQADADYYDADGGYPAEDSAARVIVRWVCGAIGVVAMALLLGLFSFSQLTEQKPAEAMLAKAMVHLSQVDELLQSPYYNDLLDLAGEAEKNGELVRLPQFPIAIELEPTEILDAPPEDLRDNILRRSAAALYNKGLDAFAEPGARQEFERLSPGWTIGISLGTLNKSAHDGADGRIQAVAAVALVAMALFVLLGRGFGRVTLLGVAVLAASLLALAGVFLVRGLLQTLTAADGDPFVEGLNGVIAEAAGLPEHNALTFAVVGGGILVFGLAMTLASRRFEYSA